LGRPTIMTAACLALLLADTCFGQSANRCFAFLFKGDVTISCSGRKTQITHRADLEGFAVSDERAELGFTTSRVVGRSGRVSEVTEETTITNLNSGVTKAHQHVAEIVSTCGGVFSSSARTDDPRFRDPVTSEVLSFPPYGWFRCSADRKTIVGLNTSRGGELWEGVPPRTKIADREGRHTSGFNISPDGSKIVFYDSRVCLFSFAGPPKCIEPRASILPDVPTVSNLGEVLVSIGTGEECFYRGMFNFSRQRSPGAKADECAGIGYWREGLQSVQLIEPLGRSPQWITPVTADLLRKWAEQQHPGAKR
jgi:hypothetical protein